jgi:hypothetical protein
MVSWAGAGSGRLNGLTTGLLSLPGPRQQTIELMGFDVAGHDALEHVLEVFEGVEARWGRSS